MADWGAGAKGAAGGAATGAAIGSIVPGWGTAIGGVAGGIIGGLGGLFGGDGDAADELRKKQLAAMSAQAQANYTQLGQQGYGALDYLRGQAQGQNSVSAEQLRQALERNVAHQQSIAAGADPRNAAMAARTASINAMSGGAGLAGQQAVAGLQERNLAQQQYAGLLQGLRGQELNAAMGASAPGQIGPAAPTWIQQYGPAIQGGLGAYAALNRPGAAAAAPRPAAGTGYSQPDSMGFNVSDRRLKKQVRDGDSEANKAIAGLRAFTFSYKEPQHGKGKQLGIMAQDLERAGLKHAVVDTPIGKVVHGAKLATSATAMVAALGRRVAKLEGGAGK